jgi:hypothetical protein
MEISVLINVHSNYQLVMDTIDSIRHYMTDKILLLVDGASKEFKATEFSVPKVNGFYHNVPKSPYRNMALGMQSLAELYPNSDWYVYLEYDCLVASNRFLKNIKLAEQQGIWMLGCDGHVDDNRMPLVEALIGESFRSVYYLLGACQFMHKDFIAKLQSIDFFEKFLVRTNGFDAGEFPGYDGYDINEHMYPSLARQFGGKVGVFASFDYDRSVWHGSHRVFPIRWKPELNPETENFPEASILHPLKSYDHPIRAYHREQRKHAFSST